ncbi:hypothetical protein [Mucilaginibacter pedocola]|uniref:hypothetical protein n=1 Tax=Mucilaginibacter pedocola TaxID=1792845 RepID=UPI0012DC9E2E|nr:hypothetical protein [Mucilaginibacter pedocola]
MKKVFLTVPLLAIMALLCGFAAFMDEQGWVNWGNKALTESYDHPPNQTSPNGK